MLNVQGVQGRTIAVLGLGRSGLSAARALRDSGAVVWVWDDNPAARAVAQGQGFDPVDLSRADWNDVDSLIVSPGIAHLYPVPNPIIWSAMQAGVAIDNDIGLFFRSLGGQEWTSFDTIPRVIAVTGTNGKSTTSTLIHHIFDHAGRPTQLAGNIGRGVFDLDPLQDGEVVVLELSSYQSELARALTPDVAVLTNLSPDHLDRHAGLGGYFAAKRRLFAEGGPDRAVIGVDEVEGQFVANQMAQGASDDRVIQVSVARKLDQAGWAVFARKGFLSEYRKGRQVASIDLREMTGLPGAHNHQNACAAYAAARAVGIAPRVIEQAMASFQGLAHRSQTIAQHAGITFVNDSKATNVDSAAKALSAFDNIRWICGGLAKDGGLDPLPEIAAQRVTRAYVIGREAAKFAMDLGIDCDVCTTMQAAVAKAASDAKSGDTVLLAPAAASMDQYDNFEQRGDDYIAQVQQWIAAQGGDR